MAKKIIAITTDNSSVTKATVNDLKREVATHEGRFAPQFDEGEYTLVDHDVYTRNITIERESEEPQTSLQWGVMLKKGRNAPIFAPLTSFKSRIDREDKHVVLPGVAGASDTRFEVFEKLKTLSKVFYNIVEYGNTRRYCFGKELIENAH